MLQTIHGFNYRVSKSQIAIVLEGETVARVWKPQQYLHRNTVAPLVISIALKKINKTIHWKQIVEVKKGLFMHHLEIQRANDINKELITLLRQIVDIQVGR